MIRAKIDVKKISKELLFQGKTALYLDCTFMENRDGPDKFGQDGFIVQDISKERRDAGERGPIIGNWKHVGQKQAPPQQRQASSQPAPGDWGDPSDEVPF